ncbi:hypothetical protein [Celeribacter sp.]|uniref:hypothetical protein n=1 Tax=Celeribacter sp. TaxID=1890673 RepID=UPI003A8E5359
MIISKFSVGNGKYLMSGHIRPSKIYSFELRLPTSCRSAERLDPAAKGVFLTPKESLGHQTPIGVVASWRFVRVLIVGEGCGESAVSVLVESTLANDCFGVTGCVATTGLLHLRDNAAAAKRENPRPALSRTRTFQATKMLRHAQMASSTGRTAE